MLLSPLAPDLAQLLIRERLQSAANAALAAQAHAANRAAARNRTRPAARIGDVATLPGATQQSAPRRGAARLNGISLAVATMLRGLALRLDPTLAAESSLVASPGVSCCGPNPC